jgi:hypothetical protein
VVLISFCQKLLFPIFLLIFIPFKNELDEGINFKKPLVFSTLLRFFVNLCCFTR